MSNIFDLYTAHELRQIFLQKEWPDNFKNWVHDRISQELLDSWLETVDNDVYRERVRDIVESETYGYRDDKGKEMLELTLGE